jgi:hypothetical protein
MSRPKKIKESNQEKPDVLFEHWIEITYECPVRGTVTEKVKGTRYHPQKYKPGALDIESLDLIKDDEEVED